MNNHVKSPTKADEAGFCMTLEEKEISFERETIREKRRLTYQPERCTGCGMCFEACPVEAIELGPLGAITTGQVSSPKVVIDPEKCVLCGICPAVCIFNAMDMEINGESMKDSPDFLRFDKDYIFYQEKCKMKDEANGVMCRDCEEVCPAEAVEAKLVEKAGKLINTMERDVEKCIYCSSCQRVCPQDAIEVKKIFEGEVKIDQDKCQGCGVCWEICPTNAMSPPKPENPWERLEKVIADQEICNHCGACEKSCPVDAIVVDRWKVNYVKEREKSWTKAWERAFNSLAAGRQDV
jgi:4Fe-4S ferredoxin